MMLVIAYDVDTTSSAGSQRLRKVARLCERHGIRVQNSVFEVLLDPAQLVALKAGLEKNHLQGNGFHPHLSPREQLSKPNRGNWPHRSDRNR